jgi:hypothetical protein
MFHVLGNRITDAMIDVETIKWLLNVGSGKFKKTATIEIEVPAGNPRVPLTLTLSRREREQPLAGSLMIESCEAEGRPVRSLKHQRPSQPPSMFSTAPLR